MFVLASLLLLSITQSIQLTVRNIESKSYSQCVDTCELAGERLATKQEILDYLGKALGGDKWAPVYDSDNNWLQIGGDHWTYGLLHTQIQNGQGGKPSWGTNVGTQSFKTTFYCHERTGELTVKSIGDKTYSQCVNACENEGKHLATSQEILDYLGGAIGSDRWTPVADSSNQWLQIGGKTWQYGKLHTQIGTGTKPSWGTAVGTRSYKTTFYCSVPALETCQNGGDQLLILRLKNVNQGLFHSTLSSTGLENENNPEANTYSIIGNLNANDFKAANEKYEFYLVYGQTQGGLTPMDKMELRWEQSIWLTDTFNTAQTLNYVPGFKRIHFNPPDVSSGDDLFYGLGKSSLPHLCYLDGTSGGPDWFNCVGAIKKWKSGIASYNRGESQSEALYACRIVYPTISPTNDPSDNPTLNPSIYPTISPSNYPSKNPTLQPSVYPTISPSNYPSDNPTISPTNYPSDNPTLQPSTSPSHSPSDNPTVNPSITPTGSLEHIYKSINYIGIPKLLSTDDASLFCKKEFNTNLATVLEENDQTEIETQILQTMYNQTQRHVVHFGYRDYNGIAKWLHGKCIATNVLEDSWHSTATSPHKMQCGYFNLFYPLHFDIGSCTLKRYFVCNNPNGKYAQPIC